MTPITSITYVKVMSLIIAPYAFLVLGSVTQDLISFDSSGWQTYPHYEQCDAQIKRDKAFNRTSAMYQMMIDDCVAQRLGGSQ